MTATWLEGGHPMITEEPHVSIKQRMVLSFMAVAGIAGLIIIAILWSTGA